MRTVSVLVLAASIAAIACDDRTVMVEPEATPKRSQLESKIDETRAAAEEQIEATKKRSETEAPQLPDSEQTQNSGVNE